MCAHSELKRREKEKEREREATVCYTILETSIYTAQYVHSNVEGGSSSNRRRRRRRRRTG